jgi:xanthine dehydrogenase YagT iron-sulfur-binding subunit
MTPMTRGTFVAGSSLTALGLHALAYGSAIAGETAPSPLPASDAAASITLIVNGTERNLVLDPRTTLLDAARDHLGLTGPKKGCDRGACGACTMLVNDRRIVSCLTLAVMHENDRIVTIEGLAPGGELHPMQAAFIKHDAFQCGYCTSGQIVSAVALLRENGTLDRDAVRDAMSGNLCRCGCYPRIVDAVLEVASA